MASILVISPRTEVAASIAEFLEQRGEAADMVTAIDCNPYAVAEDTHLVIADVCGSTSDKALVLRKAEQFLWQERFYVLALTADPTTGTYVQEWRKSDGVLQLPATPTAFWGAVRTGLMAQRPARRPAGAEPPPGEGIG
jgi:DNA-binding response OmpR family regulator